MRWESGRNVPPPRRRPALARAIAALNAEAGASLQAVLNASFAPRAPAHSAVTVAPNVASPAAVLPEGESSQSRRSSHVMERSSVELLVFRMADELDLPPRRMRGALARWLRSVRASGWSLEQVERELQAWAQRSA